MIHYSIRTLVIAGFSVVSSSASTYVSDFSGLSPGQALNGVDGWSQSAPNYSDSNGDYPRAFGTTIVTAPSSLVPAAAVGGYYDTIPPDGGKFYASHALLLPLTESISFKMSLALIDSSGYTNPGDSTVYGASRNSFSIGFNSAVGSELFALVFTPVGTVDTGSNDIWNVSSSTGGVQSNPLMAVFENQIYQMDLSLTPNGQDVNFQLSLSSSSAMSASGTLAGLAASQIDELRMGISETAGEFGTNHLNFEGISASSAAIPEPSSILLFGITTGSLLLRRRRATA